MNQQQKPNYTFALIIVIAVCFLIGFVTTMNNSMIEFCKNAFNLNDTQGQLVNSAFYGAYALSIPFGLMMSKIGYKKTLVLGLAVVGVGFIINFLCINSLLDGDVSAIYWSFLGCMFVVALGIVMLQLVANPYVMVLGSPEKGAFRMTLSQAINSVATTVAPIFILNVILSGKEAKDAAPADIPYPYLGLGLFTVLLCVILAFLKLPNINEEEQAAEAGGKVKQYKSSVFKYPHVWFGALGIFMYMGLEIGVPSMLPAYFKADPSLGSATEFLPYYWGGMMVGRFIGSAVLGKFQPRYILTTCLIGGAACVGASFALSGIAAVWAMLLAGLFHSVMWPLIFNLGLQELGPHTKAASGIINLGVVGAATLTPLMGMIVDNPALGVGVAICMMFIYYIYVLWFCWKGSKVGLK
ncbi:MAG: glucose/galactose MFS transporter [Bacteroides sp.]|nr:glucose/galactose MFS transporter [Roseburia sp.]MCM1345611.1 glucose/galactose MFS transporter [Bacteroides sp.]MCM1420754.1 glucose/galactose MFS transporter [Bacteroides sp.]